MTRLGVTNIDRNTPMPAIPAMTNSCSSLVVNAEKKETNPESLMAVELTFHVFKL